MPMESQHREGRIVRTESDEAIRVRTSSLLANKRLLVLVRKLIALLAKPTEMCAVLLAAQSPKKNRLIIHQFSTHSI